MKKILSALFSAVSLVSFAADDAGFKPLFNGKDTLGWHPRKADAHNYWQVKDGVLVNEIEKGQHGVDLVSDAKFWNFTVRYEYQVPEGSNSGFYLRGRHEIQILGDFSKGKTGKGGNGAIYNQTEPVEFVSKPGAEWQTAEVTIVGNKITATLNGKKIHDGVVCDKATGGQLDDKVGEPGPIMLQGDHGKVSFRNVRIKELPKE